MQAMLSLVGALLVLAASRFPVIVDGRFGDWMAGDVVWSDATGDGGASGLDFGELRVRSDAERLTLQFGIGAETVLQADDRIVLHVDLDGSAATGRPAHGIGADLQWRFGERAGTLWTLDVPVTVKQGALGLRQAPTHSGVEFEISIDRRSPVAGAALMPADTIAIVLEIVEPGGDLLPDAGEVLTLPLDDRPPRRPELRTVARRDATHLRVVSYNVLHDGLFERTDAFRRILRALDPDVLSLQEIRRHSPEETRDLVGEILGGESWHAAVGGDGMILSRYPIVGSGSLGGKRGSSWARLHAPPDGEDAQVVIVDPHPPCCGDDAGRQEEFDLLAAWLRDARGPGGPIPPGTPIVVAGDLNLVGDRRQLVTLLEGAIVDTAKHGEGALPDWDGTPLRAAHPLHLTGREAYTWRADDSPFAPGRLDWIVYTDSVLELAKSFVLWTPDLPGDRLAALGLQADDTSVASDHLPVVADFILPTTGSARD